MKNTMKIWHNFGTESVESSSGRRIFCPFCLIRLWAMSWFTRNEMKMAQSDIRRLRLSYDSANTECVEVQLRRFITFRLTLIAFMKMPEVTSLNYTELERAPVSSAGTWNAATIRECVCVALSVKSNFKISSTLARRDINPNRSWWSAPGNGIVIQRLPFEFVRPPRALSHTWQTGRTCV